MRAFGSHNDRLPLELCYLNAHLHEAGLNGQVMNADWTGATTYIRWSKLFENSRFLEQIYNDGSPLIDETVERIVSHGASTVVLSAADALTPWVDVGNPYLTALFSRRLRQLGIRTIGVGPFFSRVPERFEADFDVVLKGPASPTIVDIVRNPEIRGVVEGAPPDVAILPRLSCLPNLGRDDVVMTALGCPYDCSFCLARDFGLQNISIDTVVEDISTRRSEIIDFGDAILPLNLRRLNTLSTALSGVKKTFTCEVSVSTVSAQSMEALCGLGVRSVKVGLESGSDADLAAMKKRQTVQRTLEAARIIKASGLRMTAYVLLGGPGANEETTAETLRLCQEVEADDYVINVWSHHDLEHRDFRYDAHFSQRLVDEWGLTEAMGAFYALQKGEKYGLGRLI
jgi:radical SAM superfamily enzyme YgiQ (UPF0313 family)